MFRKRLVALCCFCLMSGGVMASDPVAPTATSGGGAAANAAAPPALPGMPVARPVYDDTGAFGFCLADYVYPDQRKFTVALSPGDEINLGVEVPNAGFKPGARYDLTLTPAHGAQQRVRGVAMQSDVLLLQFGKVQALQDALAASSAVTIAAAGKSMAFATPDSAAVIASIKLCDKENAGKKQPATGLPGPLQQLLGLAGFTTIKVLPLDKVPADKRPADFVWQVGHVLGGVRERENAGDKDLATLAGLHLDGLKKKCNGDFTADIEREETAPGLVLRNALARCGHKTADGEKAVIVAILFYKTAAGRFTTFTHEGSEADKAEAIADRNALRNTLLKLASQADLKPKPNTDKGH